ncbi:MAG: DUF1987 domain-containing protein [Bacteroidota bacterium]
MKALNIKATEFTPKVLFDPDNNKFEMSGESTPENAQNFYMPILEWLDKYHSYQYWRDKTYKGKSKGVVFEFKFEYFNSTSAKYILEIFKKIKKLIRDKINLRIKWYYDEPDEDMKNSGEQFIKMTKLPMELIAFIEPLMIEPTEFTPRVLLNLIENKFEISGESIPEDANTFFKPILDWLDKYYHALPNRKDRLDDSNYTETIFEFKFDYFNSTSAKYVLDILIKLEELLKDKIDLKIKWYYDKTCLDIKESGDDLAKMISVPIELVLVEN